MEEVTEGWRKLRNEQLQDAYSLINMAINMVIK
jgi:hypothetical protein